MKKSILGKLVKISWVGERSAHYHQDGYLTFKSSDVWKVEGENIGLYYLRDVKDESREIIINQRHCGLLVLTNQSIDYWRRDD